MTQPNGKITMVCAICDQEYTFTLDELKGEIERTINHMGGANLTTLADLVTKRVEWACKTCDEGASQYIH